ncbi:hypothetical protein PIECOFPK_01605 [Mycovorax composti]|jgi:hypothetical protein|uniref:Uncharacterized protein n=1 Tax=Mycovorax composti TaxID=2962693 RepID=A0ABZ2EKC1_9BACT
MLRVGFILVLVFSFFGGSLYAQTSGSRNVSVTLPAIALLDIEPAGPITLSFTKPTEAGLPLSNPTPNTSKWINYTSAYGTSGSSRIITASINQTIPGINIRLQAAAASGAGGGTRGTPAGLITLTTTPTVIISGIGRSYTGNGVGNGHQLTISVVPNNYSNLSAQTNTQVTVTYTISSN